MRRKVLACLSSAATLACAGALVLSCSSDPPVMTVTAPAAPVTASGTAWAQIEAKVTVEGEPINEGKVKFTVNAPGCAFQPISNPANYQATPDSMKTESTPSAGVATAMLYSIKAQVVNVVVVYSYPDLGWNVEKTVSVTFTGGNTTGAVGSIEFKSATPDKLKLKGAGQDQSEVLFQVLDSTKRPMEGVEVQFEVTPVLGDASVDPISTTSDINGNVKTTLSSGSVGGSVAVKATATATPSVTQTSKSISISGRGASIDNFTFVCERAALGGFVGLGQRMNCTAYVADRDTRRIPDAKVTFKAEAGSIDAERTTDSNGTAVTVYTTQHPYPEDVAPISWSADTWVRLDPKDPLQRQLVERPTDLGQEPQVPCDYWPSQVCNPRDGLVTLIAITNGEETWTDSNNNGRPDQGEYQDLGEPYVDRNDNKQWDPGEPYEDADGNNRWTGPNGVYDDSILIWKERRILWTGQYNSVTSNFYSPIVTAAAPTVFEGAFVVPHGGNVSFSILMVDTFLNVPAHSDGDKISCSCVDGAQCSGGEQGINLYGWHGKRFFNMSVRDNHSATDDPKVSTGRVLCVGTFRGAGEALTVPLDKAVTVN